MLVVHMCMPLKPFTVWCKLVGACLQASGGPKRLSQFPTRVVCPHCLQSVTFKEAQTDRHFYIVSQMHRHALLCLALQRLPGQPLSLGEGSLHLCQQAEGQASGALHSL